MINTYITYNLQRFENLLQSLVTAADIPAHDIKEAIQYALFPGGKRLRPILVYLCGQIVEIIPSCLDIIAVAIELVHCYSLVHDDLPAMDNDDFRRGKPSCHKAFSESTAILAGDAMLVLAIDILLSNLPQFLTSTQILAVTHELIKASGAAGMVSGQSLDLNPSSIPNFTEADLQLINSLKTGKLILACINMVLAASTPTPDVTISQTLRNFANQLGLVFQMQDDYLDYHPPSISQLNNHRQHNFTFCNLYKQEDLLQLINSSFQVTRDMLLPLGKAGENLLDLISYLQQRTVTPIAKAVEI